MILVMMKNTSMTFDGGIFWFGMNLAADLTPGHQPMYLSVIFRRFTVFSSPSYSARSTFTELYEYVVIAPVKPDLEGVCLDLFHVLAPEEI